MQYCWTDFDVTWQKKGLNLFNQILRFFPDPQVKMVTLAYIGRSIFEFSSTNADRIMTKLDKRQLLNILYHFEETW